MQFILGYGCINKNVNSNCKFYHENAAPILNIMASQHV